MKYSSNLLAIAAIAVILTAKAVTGLQCYECIHYAGNSSLFSIPYHEDCKDNTTLSDKYVIDCGPIDYNNTKLEPTCMSFESNHSFSPSDLINPPLIVRTCLYLTPDGKAMIRPNACTGLQVDTILTLLPTDNLHTKAEEVFFKLQGFDLATPANGTICSCSGNKCNNAENNDENNDDGSNNNSGCALFSRFANVLAICGALLLLSFSCAK